MAGSRIAMEALAFACGTGGGHGHATCFGICMPHPKQHRRTRHSWLDGAHGRRTVTSRTTVAAKLLSLSCRLLCFAMRYGPIIFAALWLAATAFKVPSRLQFMNACDNCPALLMIVEGHLTNPIAFLGLSSTVSLWGSPSSIVTFLSEVCSLHSCRTFSRPHAPLTTLLHPNPEVLRSHVFYEHLSRSPVRV